MNRLIGLLLILFACEMQVSGQYLTKRVAKLAQQTKINIDKKDLITASELDSVFSFRDKPLNVRTNEWGEVNHIGYSLFSKAIRDAQPSIIYDFLERYLLELDLLSDAERKDRLCYDGILTEGDILLFINQPTSNEQIQITFQTNHKYVIEWQRGEIKQRIGINADYKLLIGADLPELEHIFARHLRHIANNHIGNCDLESTSDDEILSVTIDQYNYKKETLRCRQSDVIKLIETDCIAIALRKKQNGQDVIFALNSEMGYIHLARFEPMHVKIFPYISVYNTPDSFINMLMGYDNQEENQSKQ